jgi:hypothetical protein
LGEEERETRIDSGGRGGSYKYKTRWKTQDGRHKTHDDTQDNKQGIRKEKKRRNETREENETRQDYHKK